MASSNNTTILLRCFLMATLVSSLFGPSAAQVKGCPFDSIYSFGDGDSSTSDGTVMADHLASAFYLPSPNPYAEEGANFDHGASFAATGATVMSTAFFVERGIQPPPLNQSVDAQLQSFTELLDSVCRSRPECINELHRALFFVDQIGANDYKYAFSQGKSIKEVSRYVPNVVQVIKNTIKKLIDVGATHLIVPGSPPFGCFPGYLTLFGAKNRKLYDSSRCHGGLNTFVRLHNDHLRQALFELRQEYPHVQIIYADYYKAFVALLRNHAILGFRKQSLMEACCGFRGRYTFHQKKVCGEEDVLICSDPAKYIRRDGFHLTQEALKHIVKAFMTGKDFVYPEFKFSKIMHCNLHHHVPSEEGFVAQIVFYLLGLL